MNGAKRKEVTETVQQNAGFQPQLLPIPSTSGGLSGSRQSRSSRTSSEDILEQVSKFVQGNLAKAVAIKQERDFLEGQMSRWQGKSFEDVKTDGNKWALEGYRIVQAKQLASAMLTIQREEIKNSAFALNPEQYREHFMSRVSESLEESPDKRTSELAREEILKQIPVLADEQLKANIQYLENKNFEELERSVDILSRNMSSAKDLVNFAEGGENSATSGLSSERRVQAVVSGVVRAFEQDNPNAYRILRDANFFKFNLSTPQIGLIRSARLSFENRRRQQYNEEFSEERRVLIEKAQNGKITPNQMVKEYSEMLENRDLTMGAQEAESIWSVAEQGMQTYSETIAAKIKIAELDGDKEQLISWVIKSLRLSESGNNPNAYRKNKDGEEYVGSMQFGKARLDDWSRYTGNPDVSLEEFANNPKLQEDIERWHVGDILDFIYKNDYQSLVGKEIKGVPVTVSGLVAVAHLGGKQGLKRFLESKGEYNPSDEVGTSLLDYMGKHSSGDNEALLSPEEKKRRTQFKLKEALERVDANANAEYSTILESLDQKLLSGLISKEKWKLERRKIYDNLSYKQVTAEVNHEAKILGSVASSIIKNAVLKDEQNRVLKYKLAIQDARDQYNTLAELVSKGQAAPELLRVAYEEFFKKTKQAAEEHKVQIRPDTVVLNVKELSRIYIETSKKYIKYQQENAEIQEAIRSKTLGELEEELITRAVEENKRDLENRAEDLVAEGHLGEAQKEDWVIQEHLTFLANTNVIDSRLSTSLNGFLNQPAIDSKGNPNPAFIEAADTYRTLYRANPSLAGKYLSPENKVAMDVILHNAGQGPLEGAVRMYGLRESENLDVTTALGFLNSEKAQKRIDDAVDDFLKENDIGFLQAAFQDDANLSQRFDMTSTGREAIFSEDNKNEFRELLRSEVEQAYLLNPRGKPSELMDEAFRRAKARSTIIAGNFIQVPKDTSLGELMFGSRSPEYSEQDGVYNTAIMEYLRSDEVREKYPYMNERSILELLNPLIPDSLFGFQIQDEGTGSLTDYKDTGRTGVRPFDVWADPSNGQIYIQVSRPEGGYYDTIALPMRRIGDMFIENHKKEVIR